MEEGKSEKTESKKETIPTPESKGEKFNTAKYEERVERYQETRKELEKESQQKDLEYLEKIKDKHSLEPETAERIQEHIMTEKYESAEGKKEVPKEEVEEMKEVKEKKEKWLFEPRFGEFSFEDTVRAERRLDNLGKVMEGANFNYWLDGGLNIPIYTGEYHRKHKDIEISVNQDEIEKLHSWAEKKGYNIFDTRSKENPKKMSSEDFKSFEINRSLLLSESEEYKGHTDTEIELHVHETDERGNQIVEGVVIPKKYFENLPRYKTAFGHEINLSHPLVTAYHKLRIERGDPLESWEEQSKDIRKAYDIEDLKELRKRLPDEDMEALEILVTEQNDKRTEGIDKRLEEIFNALDLNASESEIQRAFREKAGMAGQPPEVRPKITKAIEEICSYITKNRDLTFDDFAVEFKEIINVEEILGKIRKKLEVIKKEKGPEEKKLPKKIENLLSEKEKIRYENLEEEQEEKEKILEAVKEIYSESQGAKKQIEAGEIAEDEAKSKVKEKVVSNPMIAEYLSVHIEEIVNIAFESESEGSYINTLAEKYADEVRKKVEEKFSQEFEKEKEVEEKEAVIAAEEEIKETPETPKVEIKTEEEET